MTLTVSIPSSLSVSHSWKTAESSREMLDRRLRDQGLTRTKCPVCGHRATLEEVTVQRPGQPTVRRQMLRCRRQVPLGASSYRDKGTRCPVQVISEAPIDQDLPAVELHIEVGRRPLMKPCEQCGADILDSHGRRFCQSCYRERRLDSSRRKNAASEHSYKHPCPRCGKPCVGTQCWTCYTETVGVPDCGPPPLPEPEAARSCLDCNRSIEDRPKNAIRCVDCAGDHKRRTSREAIRAKRAAEKQGQELPPEPPQEPVEEPAPVEVPPEPQEALEEAVEAREQQDQEDENVEKPTRTCEDCGTTIEATYGRKRCKPCASQHEKELRKAHHAKARAERRPIGPCPCGCGGQVLEGSKVASIGCGMRMRRNPDSPPSPPRIRVKPALVPTLPPPPPQARLSVLTLAQQVLSLSPERQQLLQRIIEEERALREEAS